MLVDGEKKKIKILGCLFLKKKKSNNNNNNNKNNNKKRKNI